MLVLFETAVGYAIFKLTDESKLSKVDSLYKEFESSKKANKLLALQHFERFKDTTEAISSATALIEGKMNKKLKKMLKKIVLTDVSEELAVADAKLGNVIKDKLNIGCVTSSAIQELMTGIRSQIENLVPEWSAEDEAAMQLGLSHGIGRYRLKFSPDKVDTMIIQAVSLLDDLDKELNNYVMRSKEWYGWHFPEMAKIITDNTAYIRTVLTVGMRTNAVNTDLSDILPEEIEAKIKEMAEVSMGTEIAEEDMINIHQLCQNVLDLQEYRTQLFEYLKNRMLAIAPNLTVLVGELVGARLISHAGSLMNLAKHPASTVQILGAEKALFRALKTKHDTPKYGLLYHAQLIGQSNPKLKGKMSRMLAAKASLATRVDALGEDSSNELGVEHRAKLEARLKVLEDSGLRAISGTGKKRAKFEKYDNKSQIHTYKAAADSTIAHSGSKRKTFDESDEEVGESSDVKKVKTEEEDSEEEVKTPKDSKKKKKRVKEEPVEEEVAQEAEEDEGESQSSAKKKKKKKKKESAE
ncbi:nucleolar protein 58-like [Oppia nitens]|uniref:nucleolar protein 58-like n=1 Tax=Oppia nitens TaxID=1686743 RepID=UPI0023DBE44C|nr:nucleolar protein 58-like [Oppia nitens]